MRNNYISIGGARNKKDSTRTRVRYTLLILLALMICIIVVTSLGKTETPDVDQQDNLAVPTVQPIQTEPSAELPLAVEPSAPAEANGYCVVLDPGHGGVDGGCAIGDSIESEINITVSLMVKQALEDRGYEVLMTREEDITVSIDKRVNLANNNSADILVSIHQNSLEDDNVTHGIETWYNYKTNESSESLAQYIQDEVILATAAKDRGLRPDRSLIITRKAKMPSCLIESGFMTHTEESIKLQDAEYQQKIANGIVAGIEAYFENNPT